MNWISAARDLLSHPPVPTCPALTDALAAVEAGDLEGASGHLATLNEEQRLLATFIVEVAAGRGGRDGRRSGAGKVDDGGDEARGRDARIPVRSRG